MFRFLLRLFTTAPNAEYNMKLLANQNARNFFWEPIRMHQPLILIWTKKQKFNRFLCIFISLVWNFYYKNVSNSCVKLNWKMKLLFMFWFDVVLSAHWGQKYVKRNIFNFVIFLLKISENPKKSIPKYVSF